MIQSQHTRATFKHDMTKQRNELKLAQWQDLKAYYQSKVWQKLI